jgi:DNA invertase Pin-like site-specific DNA recombinase
MDREGAGLGVERQIEDCLALIRDRGWTLIETFADNDISAYSGKPRPSYRRLLSVMKAGEIDAVVAWHMDRLQRSPRDLEEWIEVCEGNRITTATVRAGDIDLETASGRMVARLLGAAARHESEQKSERVRRARQQAAASGAAHGPLGYGYNSDQTINLNEATVIREVADRLLAGETLYALATDLNNRQVPTPGAGTWTFRTVNRVLAGAAGKGLPPAIIEEVAARSATGESPAKLASDLTARGIAPPIGGWRTANLRTMIRRGTLCGWREWEQGGRGAGKGELIARGEWAPILTKEQTEQIRALLDDAARNTRGRPHTKRLLTGVLFCGRCGGPMGGSLDSRSGKARYACMSQPGMDRCGRCTVMAIPVDQMIEAAVLEVLSSSNLRSSQRPANESAHAAMAELAEARRLRDELIRERATGTITSAEWAAARPIIDARIRRAEHAAGQLHHVTVLSAMPSGRAAGKWWKAAATEQRRTVIRALIDRVVIDPAAKGGNRFDPTRVHEPKWRF